MRREIRGIGVSPGVALGRAILLDRSRMIVEKKPIEASFLDTEKERFKLAVKESKEQLLSIKDKADPKEVGDLSQILGFHIMMLEDDPFHEEVLKIIEREKVNAEWAVAWVIQRRSEQFKSIEDEYMKDRAADIYHLGERILRNLHGKHDDILLHVGEGSIVVAHDLSPLDMIQLARHQVAGFAMDVGGYTSHSAIVSRSLGIPGVMGLEDIILKATPGITVFVNGSRGSVILNPNKREIGSFKRKKKRYEALQIKLRDYGALPGRTLDGKEIRMEANIEMSNEAELALGYGAEGIGMYRTEFLFTISGRFPSEDEQFEDYKRVVSTFALNTVTIRTLDIGGDKFPLGTEPPKELNPALGLRGVRFSLKDRRIFEPQLRAILRAAELGRVRILIPMVSSIDEIREVKSIINGLAKNLSASPSVEIGVMIETPSAAIMAGEIAEEVDFLSIGTNDLIQYTLAVDRINEHVFYLFSPFHPAVLRLIKGTIDLGHKKNIPVSICGEMAGETSCVPLLIGMGGDELSMNMRAIPKIKKLINFITYSGAKEVAEGALKFKTAAEVREYVAGEIVKRWGNSLPDECVREIADLRDERKD